MIKKISFTLLSLSFLTLAGCTGMNSNFGCDARSGDSCTPVSTVNHNAEAGSYDGTEGGGEAQSSNSNTETFSYAHQSENAGYNVATPIPGQPVRYGETVQRIWIAPYEDASQNYHEPSYVYTVLNKSHWIGAPSQEISSDDSMESNDAVQ